MSLCNTSGPIGDDHRLYRLPGQFQQGQCVDWPCFINGRGGITSWGSNSNGQNGLTGSILSGVGMVFTFLDWYRSTDNGGTGIHTTLMEKCKGNSIISGYKQVWHYLIMVKYHWGYGGHGQSGDLLQIEVMQDVVVHTRSIFGYKYINSHIERYKN